MSIEKLTPFAIALAIYAATNTGSLFAATNLVRQAQIHLIQETKASKWPKAPMLPQFKRPF